MQAIKTKYMGPTNHKCARIKATCASGSIIISYDNGLRVQEAHEQAAKALCAKFRERDQKKYGKDCNSWHWTNGAWICGEFKDCYVFVNAGSISDRFTMKAGV